jgi:hypothetical protein
MREQFTCQRPEAGKYVFNYLLLMEKFRNIPVEKTKGGQPEVRPKKNLPSGDSSPVFLSAPWLGNLNR